jgi:hypothetical protein
MDAVYPAIKGHIVAEQSWLTLASKVYEKHGNIVLNVYTDEAWVTKALVQYNGKEGAHGYYEFGTIQQQDTPRLSSATALRNAVAADDRDLFGQAAGVDPNTLVAGHPFFDVVKHYLMPHAEKAAAKVAKKKVKQPEQDVAEGWKGALAGAAVGNAVGGPIGAGIGAGIGHWIGKNWNTTSSPEYIARQKKLNTTLPDDNKLLQILKRENIEDSSDLETIREYLKQNLDENGLVDIDQFAHEAAREIPFLDRMGETSDIEGIYVRVAQRVNSHIKNNKKKDVAENAWDRLQREKALESAGVGIITKQNTTVDVNKNTPKKNLKAFRLA